MDICVYTLGCKVNQYESGVVVAKLQKAGHNAFEGLKKADIFIVPLLQRQKKNQDNLLQKW